MTRVLIPTYPQDVHAIEIALALEDRGHEAVLWCGSDFPTRQTASIEIRDGRLDWEIAGPELEGGRRPPFDIVWLRRPTPPVLPPDLHPADLPVARRECHDFVSSLAHLAAPDAFWLNPLASRSRSELKPVQLREAVRAGLTIPPTLMSNDPSRIRRFLDEFAGRAVYKPFHPAQWESGDRVALLLTNEIAAGDLPEDEILRLTPGIFQARVDKAHELRVTVMGGHVVTARLLSQELEATRVDWRAAGARLRVEPDRLPEGIERACRRLMRALGIFFGCFDFIVTPGGEHVFLEVNPAGQFLWVEEANPELRLLAPFVDFLLSRDPELRWTATDGIRHADYHQRAVERARATGPLHVDPENVFVSREAAEGPTAPE
jgi:glutathione synthase/RimK-type ligase-like ATP-grasp enzyme